MSMLVLKLLPGNGKDINGVTVLNTNARVAK